MPTCVISDRLQGVQDLVFVRQHELGLFRLENAFQDTWINFSAIKEKVPEK